ncbi:MAG: lipoprotein [Gammaproteobacteria bacterium]|nr:lipoprotein [Gammaproteobacteria bacterium]
MKALIFILIGASYLLLVGCGQVGPLYLPKTQPTHAAGEKV